MPRPNADNMLTSYVPNWILHQHVYPPFEVGFIYKCKHSVDSWYDIRRRAYIFVFDREITLTLWDSTFEKDIEERLASHGVWFHLIKNYGRTGTQHLVKRFI